MGVVRFYWLGYNIELVPLMSQALVLLYGEQLLEYVSGS